MLYFIPAWYSKGEWKETEQFWYMRRMNSETDDSVKQIQLFQRNKISDYRIMLLSFTPNLRHFLHRNGVYRAPYWSLFDAIQGIRRSRPALLSFHSLNWPDDIEFIYSPFALIAMLHGQKYAQVEFGEYGNMIQIDLYENGVIRRKNIYDDRGFVSCTVLFENGEKVYEQYLNEEGKWIICVFADNHVVVNPKQDRYLIRYENQEKEYRFLKHSYASLPLLLKEVLAQYVNVLPDSDIFCAAFHTRHAKMIRSVLSGKKLIWSMYENRVPAEFLSGYTEIMSEADKIVADSEKNSANIKKFCGLDKENITTIPLYDTRMDSGISQKLNVQKILFPIDRIPQELFDEIIIRLAEYMNRNVHARVHLFTRDQAYNKEESILMRVQSILSKFGYPSGWAAKENLNRFEFRLDEEEQVPIKFFVEQCLNELAMSKCVREQRVLLDLSRDPDSFLQIACVSMGIPQILRHETTYMIPGKNGRINRNIQKLGNDLAYYLESLANWNRAMIASYELGKSRTSDYLIKKWKEVIENIG